MSDFDLPSLYEAAFCAVNTFRHLIDENPIKKHFKSVKNNLKTGGIYAIDLDLFRDSDSGKNNEQWEIKKKNTHIKCRYRTLSEYDKNTGIRLEELTLRIEEEDNNFIIRDSFPMKVWTPENFRSFIDKQNIFEILYWYAPSEYSSKPVDIREDYDRVVVVLKK